MLQKNRSQRIKLIKYGLSAPLFVLMLVLSSATISNSKAVETINAKADAVLESSAKDVINGKPAFAGKPTQDVPAAGVPVNYEATVIDTIPNKAKYVVDIMPSFPGGDHELGKFLANNVKYPTEARNKKIEGRTVITFLVGTDGALSDFKVLKSVGAGIDEEALRVLRMSPKWRPATSNGKPVKAQISVPVNFTLDKELKASVETQQQLDGKPVFTAVEQSPAFPGGDEAFSKFVSQNVKYPKEAREKNIKGRVIASFIVEEDGSLSNIKIVRGVGYGTDEEAMRVLSISPKWKPGKQNGHAVRVQYALPINFALSEEHPAKETRTGAIPAAQPKNYTLLVDSNKNWISLKGPSQPLYVVDGNKVSSISNIKPNDIQSITVLKDQNAILKYGKDGDAGVVEVTTKAKSKYQIKTK